MTREKAIKLLELFAEIATLEESKECCELTIEALKQPEIIRCKDCEFKQWSCCAYRSVYLRPDGFCERGKKKDSVQEIEAKTEKE